MSVKLFVLIVLLGISYTLAFPTELASSSIVEKGGDVIVIIRKIRQADHPQPLEGENPSHVNVIDEEISNRILKNDNNMGTDLDVDATQDGEIAFVYFIKIAKQLRSEKNNKELFLIDQ